MTSPVVPVITVDGPSGVGKGTISLLLARRLGWHFLDSGALYRLTALAARNQHIEFEDKKSLAECARSLDVRFEEDAGRVAIILAGKEVGGALRTEAAGADASRVAAVPEVREALLQRQRDFATSPGLIADGRDMGTTVFPQASVKIFLDASVAVRAERRYKQLIEKGFAANLAGLAEEIAERDARDRNRPVSPLRPAMDALIIDTSDLGINDVFELVWQHCQQFVVQ